MGFRIAGLFSAPIFEDAEKTRAARLINVISWTLALIAFSGMLAAPVSDPGRPQAVLASGVFVVIALIAQFLLRYGRVIAAALMLVAVSWAWNTISLITLGGMTHPFANIYYIVILSAGLILGGRAAIITTAATVVASMGLMAAEGLGFLTAPVIPPFARWITGSLLFAFAALLLYIAVQSINRALNESHRNQRELLVSNRELNTIRAELEQRVAERTADLSQQNRYLEATTDVSRTASTVLELDSLIRDVAEMIRSRFELYYVGLFLLDENQEWAILRSGTGEAGRTMLARGHRIQVGSGMIGWCIANAQPRVALEAERDDVRLHTPELPETRSEAALPLRSRGYVIGALTVQSEHTGAFTPDVITVLQTLADQVAIAIDNARLYSQSQNTLEAIRRAYGDISRQAWMELSATRKDWGYVFTDSSLKPIQGPLTPEMQAAMQSGQAVLLAEAGGDEYQAGQRLIVPIKVRGHAIGVLNLKRRADGGEWAQIDIDALETISDRLSSALESARLYRESQGRAVRESLISDISARMRSTLNVDMILKTAAREMRSALDLEEVELRLGDQSLRAYTNEDTIPQRDNGRSENLD